MSIVPEHIYLSIQRPIKIGEYKYPKIELGMIVKIQDVQPNVVFNKLYKYLDAQVDRLLEAELAKVGCNRQTVADKMIENDDDIPFCFETE